MNFQNGNHEKSRPKKVTKSISASFNSRVMRGESQALRNEDSMNRRQAPIKNHIQVKPEKNNDKIDAAHNKSPLKQNKQSQFDKHSMSPNKD